MQIINYQQIVEPATNNQSTDNYPTMTRKELKDEYKQQKFRIGVFQVRNTVNGKIFIEGSVNLDKIWNRHRTELNFGSHSNKALQQDWKTFGEENFVYEILDEIKQEEGKNLDHNKEIKQLEQMYVDELQPFDERGYHKRPNRGGPA